jgi:integrase
LSLMSWSPERETLIFPQSHPVLGWQACHVAQCGKYSASAERLCASCLRRWRNSGRPPLQEFVAITRPRCRAISVSGCAVVGCSRPAKNAVQALCGAHLYQQRHIHRLSLPEFLAHPAVVGLPPFGPCLVTACTRDRTGQSSYYCDTHAGKWRQLRRDGVDIDELLWRRTESAIPEDNNVSMRGLPRLVVAEMIYGLQERTKRGTKTLYHRVRALVDRARRLQVTSFGDSALDSVGPELSGLRNSIMHVVGLIDLSAETERHKDIWNTVAFGHNGTISFTRISQPWLREAAKHWTYNHLPRRRGAGAVQSIRGRLGALVRLSESLRLHRGDHGDNPAHLGRSDILSFCHRLAYLQEQGVITIHTRLSASRCARIMLSQMRTMGLTRPGQPLHGLPDEFALSIEDIPDEPEDTDAGKDRPVEVMRHLCEHLPTLDTVVSKEIRVAIELLIDTGRRPDEICQLSWDCLERDGDGKPVLIYDNIKSYRLGRRLPIAEATAALILDQQERTRTRFPHTPPSELKLLSSSRSNPHGTKSITDGDISVRHRTWVNSLPPILIPVTVDADDRQVTRMMPFDATRIFPYAYRHIVPA